MKTIGLDIDGTLSDSWTKSVHDYLVQEYGEKRSHDEFWSADIRHEQYPTQLWENMVRMPTFFTKYSVDPKFPETISEIAKEYTIYYVTHREEEIRFTTQWWLKSNHFPYPNNLYLSMTPKEVTVRLLGCDYFVEDRPSIIEALRGVTKVIVSRRPWNEHIMDLPTIDTILELPELLKRI